MEPTQGDNRAAEARARLAGALSQVAAGDRAALRRVYDLTSAKLFGICLRICNDREAAEDVLQNVYVSVWRRAGRFDAGRASPITWLATIARNAAIDWRRSEARHVAEPESAAAEIPDAAPLADALVADAQDGARIHHCLETLEERQQAAIRTTFFEGLTYQELAERLDTPLGTVKSWIRRGLTKLKACLGDD